MKFNLIEVGSKGIAEVWDDSSVQDLMTFDPLDPHGVGTFTKHFGTRIHYPKAAFDFNGVNSFNICKREQMSSLFEPNIPELRKHFGEKVSMFEVVERIEVECVRLDGVLSDIDIRFDFLKVDAQGAELNVLKGADSLLTLFKGIQIECNHVPFYSSMSTTGDIDKYLRANGFIFERQLFYKRNADVKDLVWNDRLYINERITQEDREFIISVYDSEIFVEGNVK